MAQPNYTYKVATPFAINGSKDEIPTTTEDGSVSLENGYGTLYETPPSEGGRFIRRGEWNYLINFLYNAIKELQDIITAGEFTVSASQTLTSILPIALGGTGADTPEGARNNLGLGNVNNTSDLNKPISTATQNALDNKLNLTGGTINGNLTITGVAESAKFISDVGTPNPATLISSAGYIFDSDTGMFSAGDGILNFYANSIERFKIFGGTIIVSGNLTVNGSCTGDTFIRSIGNRLIELDIVEPKNT